MSTESMVTQALEPCAHCGGEAVVGDRNVQYNDWQVRYAVNCIDCYASSGWYDTEAEAIGAWNTRTAAQPEREAVLEGWLVERLSGEGYGKARMVLDARQYDASKPAFFVNEEARGRHRVTPLFAALTTPAPIVSRDEIVALLVDLKDRRPPDRYDSDAELSDRLDAILSRLRGAEQ